MECLRRVNPFRACAGLRFLGYLMVALVAAIVAVSYYAVVVYAWGPVLLRRGGEGSVAAAAIILTAFHLLLAMMLWCYLMVVFTNPGSVPENWRHAAEEDGMDVNDSMAISNNVAKDSVNHPLSISEEQGHAPRYCSRCQNGKPPRCHHCSVCDRCVLKMDHHCVWVVNCVGARNYKYFLLFLYALCRTSSPSKLSCVLSVGLPTITVVVLYALCWRTSCGWLQLSISFGISKTSLVYTFFETLLDISVLLPSFITFFQDESRRSNSASDIAILFLAFVLNLVFALSLLCFLGINVPLAVSNTTSTEVYERKKPHPWKYDLGWRKNSEQVFGTKKLLWFLPMYCSEDLHNITAIQGLEFPTRSDAVV